MSVSQIVRFWVASVGCLNLTLTFGLMNLGSAPVWAQVVPDNTLGTEQSTVNTIDALRDRIDGGAIRGSNLFHSFLEFGVGQGRGIYFSNPTGIDHILARVTGNKPSQFFGQLGVLGSADLFFVNPNGILFGKDATLDMKGSFVATTADGIQLGDQGFFNAREPQNSNLLSIAPKALFLNQLSSFSGNITNQGDLRAGRNLMLAANNLDLQGTLSSIGDLSLEASDTINVYNGGQIFTTTEDLNSSGNIKIVSENLKISDKSQIFTLTLGMGDAGNISITANNLLTKDGSFIYSDTYGDGNGGSININAFDTINLIETVLGLDDFPSGVFTDNDYGSGNAGDIQIVTKNLNIEGNAGIGSVGSVYQFGSIGNSGNIYIDSSESIKILGGSLKTVVNSSGFGSTGNINIKSKGLLVTQGGQISTYNKAINDLSQNGNIYIESNDITLDGLFDFEGILFPSGIFSDSDALAKPSKIKIVTDQLTIQGGADIRASTISVGNSGSIEIFASKLIKISGEKSSIFTEASCEIGFDCAQLTGNAGNIKITTKEMNIEDGAAITSVTDGYGRAGDISINLENLFIEGGSQVTAGSFGGGDGGTINVNASGFIKLIGISPDGKSPSGFFAKSEASGKAGDLFIKANYLTMSDGAKISSENSGTSNAGKTSVTVARDLIATNSDIFTSSALGSGGEIDISARNIQLRGDSDLRSNVAQGAGGGGNITFTADSIIAFDDSDILAFARDGQGGDITLNTPVFFGARYQPAPLGTDPNRLDGNDRVDINASGAVSGQITLPDLSFITNNLTELPDNLLDADKLIANSCVVPSRQQEGKFIITGSGGLPERPGDVASSAYPTGAVQAVPEAEGSVQTNSTDDRKPGRTMIEPQGVYQLTNGQMVLSRECP